ncbi:MAG: amidohydrolase family protein [Planctomycetota bacterium]|nr:amidohydrolase family protein [Planctomycetota bacterium]
MMFTKTLTLYLLTLSTATALASPEVPGAKQTQPIALVGGTVHTVSGETIENATILFEQGKIVAVGKQVSLRQGVQIIQIPGKHVFPGMLDAYTNMGLVEINAVRASDDEQEVGNFNPNVRAEVAVNPDSEIIPTTRSNGVLLCLSAPSGGLVSGRSAVLQLDGWTYEDLTIHAGAGLHVNWPSMALVNDWWVSASAKDQIASREKALLDLTDKFDMARRYDAARSQNPDTLIDVKWESMRDILAGNVPLIVTANNANQIQAAVAFAVRQKVKLIINGGYDAIYCADLLKKHAVPVILGGVYRTPRRTDDFYDLPYEMPAILNRLGVQFCISSDGRFGASMSRNLPFHAGTAAAYGLPVDEAVKAVTLYPAQILGVDKQVGSLEVGKDATLVITDGHLLEIATQVEQTYVQGRRVDMSDRHKRLWNKYQQRYQPAK